MHCAILGILSSLNFPVWGLRLVIGWKKAEMSIRPSLSLSKEGMKQKSALKACRTTGSPLVGNPMISFELVAAQTVPSSACSKSITLGAGVWLSMSRRLFWYRHFITRSMVDSHIRPLRSQKMCKMEGFSAMSMCSTCCVSVW